MIFLKVFFLRFNSKLIITSTMPDRKKSGTHPQLSTSSSPHQYRTEIDHSYAVSHTRTTTHTIVSPSNGFPVQEKEKDSRNPKECLLSSRKNLEQKVSKILTDFKINARKNEISTKIVQEIEKYCDYRNDAETPQPTTSNTPDSVDGTPSVLSSGNNLLHLQPRVELIDCLTTNVVTPSKTVYSTSKTTNKVVVVKSHGKKTPKNELARLANTDGYIFTPPREHKRTPKAVTHYNANAFEMPKRITRQSSNMRDSLNVIQQKTIKKKIIRRNATRLNFSAEVTPHTSSEILILMVFMFIFFKKMKTTFLFLDTRVERTVQRQVTVTSTSTSGMC